MINGLHLNKKDLYLRNTYIEHRLIKKECHFVAEKINNI